MAKFFNCFAKGDMQTGSDPFGGFCTVKEGQTHRPLVEFTNCYFIGEVTNAPSGSAIFFGKEGSHSYYNSNIGSNKTMDELREKETFEDWNFTHIWKIDPDVNDGTPFLYGDVVEAEIIKIYTVSDLYLMNNSSGIFQIQNDIEASSMVDSVVNFDGFLDGQHYTISGLKVCLFDTLRNAKVYRTHLIRVDIKDAVNPVGGFVRIVPNESKPIFEQCSVKGDVVGTGGAGMFVGSRELV